MGRFINYTPLHLADILSFYKVRKARYCVVNSITNLTSETILVKMHSLVGRG